MKDSKYAGSQLSQASNLEKYKISRASSSMGHKYPLQRVVKQAF